MKTPTQVSPWRAWWIAARPWALPASTMPVLFGTVLAVTLGGAPWQTGRFLIALLAMILLHSAANMLSDVSDFNRGLDTEVTPVSGALVRGWLCPESVRRAAFILFALGVGLGAGLAWATGAALWWIGVAGVFIGTGYSALKYRALGDAAVFLNFGLLGAAGAWVVQTRVFSLYPLVAAVPMALLVVAILHANNWRDITSDTRGRVRTMAGGLGDRGSLVYYGALLLIPFLWVAMLSLLPRFLSVGVPPLPGSVFLVFLAAPLAFILWRRACRRHQPRAPMDFIVLDGATAQLNLLFGLLYVGALLLDAAWKWRVG